MGYLQRTDRNVSSLPHKLLYSLHWCNRISHISSIFSRSLSRILRGAPLYLIRTDLGLVYSNIISWIAYLQMSWVNIWLVTWNGSTLIINYIFAKEKPFNNEK